MTEMSVSWVCIAFARELILDLSWNHRAAECTTVKLGARVIFACEYFWTGPEASERKLPNG